MSEEIKETLDDVKRHLDYVEATKRSSTRDNEMKEMYEYITSLQQKVEQLENIRKEAIKWIKLMGKYENGSCTRNFKLMSADFNYLLNILNKGDNKDV